MKICIYGSASDLINKAYIEAGEKLGVEIAKRGHELVYGGGGGGLMGAVARGAHSQGGHITAIVPTFFTSEGKIVDGKLFQFNTREVQTDSMRERKTCLDEMSDAFIITPGGIGTFDEFFEMITLKSLGRHDKPMVIFNTNGYYDDILKIIEKGIDSHFIKSSVKDLIFVSDNIKEILNFLEK